MLVRPWLFGTLITNNALTLVRSSNQNARHADAPQFDITTGDLSIEAWVNPASQPADTELYAIIAKFSAGFQRSYYFSYAQLAPQFKIVMLTMDNGNVLHAERWIRTLPTGEWNHLALAWDTSAAPSPHGTLWLNTVDQGAPDEDTAPNITNIKNSSTAFRIGMSEDGTLGYDGMLFDVRFWNKMITGPEVAAGWRTIQDPATANLVGNWYVGDADHLDHTVNGNDLTPANNPTFANTGPY